MPRFKTPSSPSDTPPPPPTPPLPPPPHPAGPRTVGQSPPQRWMLGCPVGW